MSKQELIVGYDLCADYSQISYFDMEKMEPDSVAVNQQMQIPTALCKVFADGQWLSGQAALDAAGEGRGVLVRGFAENIGNDPLVDVAGERMEKTELIYLFVADTLRALDTIVPGAVVGFLTLTAVKMDLVTADAFKNVGSRLGIPAGCLSMQSHMLSYEYYALCQRRELWTHDVGLFEYDRHGLRYHHLSVSWKHHPPAVTSETTDLTAYLNGHELDSPVGPEMDRKFLEAIRQVSARRTISTYYLVGEGFEDAGAGSGWMNISLQQLCAMRRHVFVGQNLYARGACYNSYYQAAAGRKPGFLPVNADLLMKEVYIRSIHRNAPRKVMLVTAGTPWYNAAGENYLLVDGCDQLILHVRDTITNLEHTVAFPIACLPERPAKTTKLLIQTVFDAENMCHITAKDVGFGEIFAGTGKIWEMVFDINETLDAAAVSERGSVIEATMPAEAIPLDMKMSGVRIYSLEELCWYLAENVYAITMDLFDETMFYWMDKVTGNHSLALALNNYKEGGKPLKEIVRLLLNSVDYLSNSEIAYVYNKLSEIERQNPAEHARMAADNYCRFGRYMAALKTYHHVIYQMEHVYSHEVTRQFKAETWHNMGIAFLKLHNVASAAACMQKAFELVKDQSYLEPYIFALQLLGAQDRILETARQENIPASMIDGILAKYQKAEASYETSERGEKLKAGLALKKEQRLEDYSRYVEAYLEQEKKKYELA